MAGLLQGLSSSPLVAGRAFLAAFLLALAARLGVGQLESPPEWFISNTALWVLGVLAFVEVAADKMPEARELLLWVDNYAKPSVAFALTLGVFGPETSSLLGPLVENPGYTQAGFQGVIPFLLAGVNAAGTLFLVRARNTLLGLVVENDQDDDSGLGGAASWLTDLYVVGGVVLFVLAPLIAFILTGLALLAAAWVQREAVRREKKARVACSQCAHENLTVALKCGGCGEALAEPKRLSFLGTATSSHPVTDLAEHRHSLLQWRRCPDCGTSLPKKSFCQKCPECARQTFENVGEAEAYLSRVEGSIPRIVVVSAAMGLVPVLGLVAGVLYYRWSLIPGLRRYLTRAESFGGRWMVRGVNFVILWFQPVPLLGALVLPAMCLTNYKFYRHRFRRHLESMRLAGPSGQGHLPTVAVSANIVSPEQSRPLPPPLPVCQSDELEDEGESFQFECPSCQGEIRAFIEWRGLESECPHCFQPLLVPETDPVGARG